MKRRRFLTTVAMAGAGVAGSSQKLWSAEPGGNPRASATRGRSAWEPVGLSGGGGMFAPAISAADPNLMMLNCDMSAAYLSEDGGRNWRMIHHAQLRSDTHCQPAFHPLDINVIYASAGGRLKVSRDRGRTFEALGNLTAPLGGMIALHPELSELMLVGSRGGQCHLSRDAGLTWTLCVGPAGQLLGVHFGRQAQRSRVLVATDKGVWRSEDEGRTWAQRTRGLPWLRLQGFAGGSTPRGDLSVLYCSVESRIEDGGLKGGIYRSRDGGENWESAMGTGINLDTKAADQYAFGPVAQYRHLLTTDAQPLTVYATNTSTGFHPPHHETVYRSDDAGQSWRPTFFQDPRFTRYNVAPDYVTASTGQCFKGGEVPFGVAICGSDPNRVLLVENECYVSLNGGVSWFAGHTYPAPGQKPGPRSAWVCNGLVVTTTWHYAIHPREPNRHYIAYADIGLARSLDAGRTWIWWDNDSWAPWRNTCYELVFDPAKPERMWGAFSNVHDIPNDNIISERHGHKAPGGVCVSRDFGASWQHEAQGIPPRPVTSIVLDPRSPEEARVLYAGVFDEGVFKSIDSGRSWVLKSQGLGHPANLRVSRVALHRDGTLLALVCAKRSGPGRPLIPEGVGLYRSRDGAETWEKVNASTLFLYPKDFSMDPRDSRHILLGVCDSGGDDRSGGLYRTRDGGGAWERVARQGPQTFGGYFHPKFVDWIYLTLTEDAPGPGLWLSRDQGRSWQPFSGLPFANIQRVEFDPSDESRMHVTTFGASVWRGPIQPQDT